MTKIPYNREPTCLLKSEHGEIPSFLGNQSNFDSKTVESFGEEWTKFSSFQEDQLSIAGSEYFDLLEGIDMSDWNMLDAGCGSGRWSRVLADRVKHIDAVDPSLAILVAANYNRDKSNMRFTQASIDDLPFDDGQFDFVLCLGVLHHMPDTASAIKDLYKKLKPNGKLLLYLYYALDNRGGLYRFLFQASSRIRSIVSMQKPGVKRVLADLIGFFIYLPLVSLSRLFSLFSSNFAQKMPLSYYANKSFHIMRNDALDRFGTPLEQRFSKSEIQEMLNSAGFKQVTFSDNVPFWHCLAIKNELN